MLGAGGSALAYRALDGVTGQRRVLKVFRPENPAASRRASEEFRRLHELSHPNIVRVWDLARSAEGAPASEAHFVPICAGANAPVV